MSIENQLNSVFQLVFDDDELQIYDAMTADDVEGWNSLSHVHLVVAVEKEFNVRFKTSEMASLKNVGDFIALIERKAGNNNRR